MFSLQRKNKEILLEEWSLMFVEENQEKKHLTLLRILLIIN